MVRSEWSFWSLQFVEQESNRRDDIGYQYTQVRVIGNDTKLNSSTHLGSVGSFGAKISPPPLFVPFEGLT